MTPLEVQNGALVTALAVGLVALGCLVMGVHLRRMDRPFWVTGYPGKGPSFFLSLPFYGLGMVPIVMGFFIGDPPTHPLGAGTLVLAGVLFAGLACLALALVTSLFWFPRAWLPRWYRRAQRAGVTVTDLEEMMAFKQLSEAEQEARADAAPSTRRTR